MVIFMVMNDCGEVVVVLQVSVMAVSIWDLFVMVFVLFFNLVKDCLIICLVMIGVYDVFVLCVDG